MRIYVRGSDFQKIEFPEVHIDIVIDMVIHSNITASTDNYENLPISDEHERMSVSDEFRTYVESVLCEIEGEGFKELEHTSSNGRKSQSVYFIFCYENEFYIQKVHVTFTLRLSNHPIHMKPKDTSQSVADGGQEAFLRDKINDKYGYLSDTDDDIYVIPSYVTYNGDYKQRYMDILREVRHTLRSLKQKFPSDNSD